MFSEAAPALRLGSINVTVQASMMRNVGECVDMRTDMAAGDNQLIGARAAVRPHQVAVAPLQCQLEFGVHRALWHAHERWLAQVENLDTRGNCSSESVVMVGNDAVHRETSRRRSAASVRSAASTTKPSTI